MLRIILQKTYELQDVDYYNTFLENYNGFTVPTGVSASISPTDGLTVVGTTTNTVLTSYDNTLPSDFVVEMDIVAFGLGTYNVSAEPYVCDTSLANRKDGSTNRTTLYSFNPDSYTNYYYHPAPFHLKIVKQGTTVSYYIDDVLLGSRNSNGAINLGFRTYQNRSVTVKNYLIKAL